MQLGNQGYVGRSHRALGSLKGGQSFAIASGSQRQAGHTAKPPFLRRRESCWTCPFAMAARERLGVIDVVPGIWTTRRTALTSFMIRHGGRFFAPRCCPSPSKCFSYNASIGVVAIDYYISLYMTSRLECF